MRAYSEQIQLAADDESSPRLFVPHPKGFAPSGTFATEVGTILITNLLCLTIASVNDLDDEKFRCVTL